MRNRQASVKVRLAVSRAVGRVRAEISARSRKVSHRRIFRQSRNGGASRRLDRAFPVFVLRREGKDDPARTVDNGAQTIWRKCRRRVRRAAALGTEAGHQKYRVGQCLANDGKLRRMCRADHRPDIAVAALAEVFLRPVADGLRNMQEQWPAFANQILKLPGPRVAGSDQHEQAPTRPATHLKRTVQRRRGQGKD